MRRRLCIVFALALVVTSLVALPVHAASLYANPAFEAQWRGDEAKLGNFWGPLSLAKEGQQEDYAEAAGGKRLVQYFDKGRMELGADGTVTSGLLGQELISGRVQTGNTTFANRAAYDYPVVGDARSDGLTYARISRTPDITAPTPMSSETLAVFRYGTGTEQARMQAADYYNTTTYAGGRILAMPAYDDPTR